MHKIKLKTTETTPSNANDFFVFKDLDVFGFTMHQYPNLDGIVSVNMTTNWLNYWSVDSSTFKIKEWVNFDYFWDNREIELNPSNTYVCFFLFKELALIIFVVILETDWCEGCPPLHNWNWILNFYIHWMIKHIQ